MKIFSILSGLLLIISTVSMGQSFDQITRPVATLTDRAVMNEILTDLIIPIPSELTSIQMVDITSNGYGPDDLLIINPTLDVHYIGDFIPPSLRSMIAQWDLEVDFRYDVIREVTSQDLITAHMEEDPGATIAGICINAIDTHYSADNMNILLKRNASSVRVELWGYDPSALSYGGPSESAACEINRQRFKYARPIQVTAFKDPSACIETWTENGQVQTTNCN